MSAARAFVFGKLPRHGDFVARGLTAEAQRAWDGWLSADLDRSKDELGDDFSAAHETAPPWRFVRAPGAFGPGGQAGALAPSIDAAGRRFFIVVGGEGPPAAQSQAIAEQMEALIYRALEENLDADCLARAAQRLLDEAPEAGGAGCPSGELWWTEATQYDRPPGRLIGPPRGEG